MERVFWTKAFFESCGGSVFGGVKRKNRGCWRKRRGENNPGGFSNLVYVKGSKNERKVIREVCKTQVVLLSLTFDIRRKKFSWGWLLKPDP